MKTTSKYRACASQEEKRVQKGDDTYSSFRLPQFRCYTTTATTATGRMTGNCDDPLGTVL